MEEDGAPLSSSGGEEKRKKDKEDHSKKWRRQKVQKLVLFLSSSVVSAKQKFLRIWQDREMLMLKYPRWMELFVLGKTFFYDLFVGTPKNYAEELHFSFHPVTNLCRDAQELCLIMLQRSRSRVFIFRPL